MIVYGKNVFNETDPKSIRRVKLSPTFKDQEIMRKIKENHIKYIVSDQRDLDRIALHNQGIVIEINDYEYKDLSVIGKEETINRINKAAKAKIAHTTIFLFLKLALSLAFMKAILLPTASSKASLILG